MVTSCGTKIGNCTYVTRATDCAGEIPPAAALKAPPFMVKWNKGCTPYPAGSLVLDCNNNLWGHICPDGEYSPPGSGSWRPINMVRLVAMLINPTAFLIAHLGDAMGCPDLTSKMVFVPCEGDAAAGECVEVKTFLKSECALTLCDNCCP